MSDNAHITPLLELSGYEPETNQILEAGSDYYANRTSQHTDVKTAANAGHRKEARFSITGANWKIVSVVSVSMVSFSFLILSLSGEKSDYAEPAQHGSNQQLSTSIDAPSEKNRILEIPLTPKPETSVIAAEANGAAQLTDKRTELGADQIQAVLKVRQEIESIFWAEYRTQLAAQKQKVQETRIEWLSRLDSQESRISAEQNRLSQEREHSREWELRILEHETVAMKEGFPIDSLVSAQKSMHSDPGENGGKSQSTPADEPAPKKSTPVATQEQQIIQERLERLQSTFFAELEKLAQRQRNKVVSKKSLAAIKLETSQTRNGEPADTQSRATVNAASELFTRVGEGNITHLQKYLKRGGNPDQSNALGEPLLVKAASNDQYIIVSELLRAGANIELTDNNGENALKYASIYGHTGVVTLLISEGADVNFSGAQSETALIAASKQSHDQIVQILIAAGAQVNTRDSIGRSALYYAIKHNDTAVSDILLDSGAEKNLVQSDGEKLPRLVTN